MPASPAALVRLLRWEQDTPRQALVQRDSNGISEYFVNKIKGLMRQIFGRVNVNLLRTRC